MRVAGTGGERAGQRPADRPASRRRYIERASTAESSTREIESMVLSPIQALR